MSMRKYSLRSKLLLSCAATVVALVLAEGIARQIHTPHLMHPRMAIFEGYASAWAPPGSQVLARDGRNHFLPNITFKHCYSGPGAGHMEPDNCITYATNRWGFRDVEYDWEKPANTYRILLLGDSFTFGEGTRFEEIYPRRLAQALRSRRLDGRSIEVINMAMPGDNTVDQFHIYDWVAATVDPDLVILQWNTNDFPADSVTIDHLRLIGVDYQNMYAASHKYEWSALVHLVWYRWRMSEISEELREVTNRDLELGAINFYQILEFSRRVTADDSREFVLLIFPELIRFDDYPYSQLINGVVEFCSQANIPCIDLLPALSRHRDEELWAHPTDHHPNCLAHEIAAREILRFLEPRLSPANE